MLAALHRLFKVGWLAAYIQHADIELLIKILTLPVAIRTSLEGVIDAFLEQNKT